MTSPTAPSANPFLPLNITNTNTDWEFLSHLHTVFSSSYFIFLHFYPLLRPVRLHYDFDCWYYEGKIEYNSQDPYPGGGDNFEPFKSRSWPLIRQALTGFKRRSVCVVKREIYFLTSHLALGISLFNRRDNWDINFFFEFDYGECLVRFVFLSWIMPNLFCIEFWRFCLQFENSFREEFVLKFSSVKLFPSGDW